MKVFKSKKLISLAAVALLLTAVVGGTLAYVFTSTGPVTNTFQPTQVTTTVEETFENKVKTDVKIGNTGDTDAYIRATVVVTWKSESGSVYAQKPGDDDYSITYETGNGWTQGPDGYWYYSDEVAPGATTLVFISKAEQLNPGPVGSDGTQYYLSIEIVASGIQSTGTGATSALNAWTAAQSSQSN